MENITFFGGNDIDSTEELPWVKDWAKSSKNPGESQEVFTARVSEKGLFVETGAYKAFIFKRQSVYGFLIEALDTWVKTKQHVKPLVMTSDSRGKAYYGIHEEKELVIWNKTEELYYSRRVNDGKPISSRVINPFLQSNSPATSQNQEPKPKAKNGAKTKLEAPTEGNKAD